MTIKPWLFGGAVCAIVAGSGWAGTSWYGSQQIQKRYQQASVQLNQRYADLLNYQVVSYKKGMLNSQVEWKMSFTPDPCQPDQQLSLTGRDEVKHGLRPNFSVAQIETHIHWPDEIQPKLTEIFGEQEPLKISTRVALNGDFKTQLSSPALNLERDDTQVEWQGLEAEFEFDGDQIEASLLMPKLHAQSAGQGQVILDQLRYETKQTRHGNTMIATGQGQLTLDSLQVQMADRSIGARGVLLASETKLVDQQLTGQLDYQIKTLQHQQQDVGNLAVKMTVSALDAALADQSYQAVFDLKSQCKPASDAVWQAVKPALASGFKFNLDVFKLTLWDGDATLKAQLTVPKSNKSTLEQPAALLSKIDASADMNISDILLSNVAERVFAAQGQAASPAEIMSTLNMLLSVPVKKGLLVKTPTGYESKLQVSAGQPTVNGQPLR